MTEVKRSSVSDVSDLFTSVFFSRKQSSALVLSPSDDVYYYWLVLISTAVFYNWTLLVVR